MTAPTTHPTSEADLYGFHDWLGSASSDLDRIVTVVAAWGRVAPAQVRRRYGTQQVANARHVIFYLARLITDLSFPVIARELGHNHSTVISSCRKVAARVAAQPEFARQLNRLETEVRQARQVEELARRAG